MSKQVSLVEIELILSDAHPTLAHHSWYDSNIIVTDGINYYSLPCIEVKNDLLVGYRLLSTLDDEDKLEIKETLTKARDVGRLLPRWEVCDV